MNDLEKTGNRLIITLLLSRSIYTAAYLLMVTVSSIVVVEMAGGNNQWTGIPGTLTLVSAALVAYPIGRLMDRVGRRNGLSLGYVLGIGGALLAGWAVLQGSLPLLLLGIFLAGAARGTNELGRYAAAEASPAHRRGRALSLFILGGTVGSVFGPALVDVTNNIASSLGMADLSGPWFGAAILMVVGLLVTFVFLRPDPQEIARRFADSEPAQSVADDTDGGRSVREVLRDTRAQIAIGAMVFSQLAMVVVMTVTSVYMRDDQQELSTISLVIMAHTLGMFGLSYLTGWLVDRIGREKMIMAGTGLLVFSCVMAPLSSEPWWLVAALFLLGLGWNFAFVAGSTLLDDTLRIQEKGRVQGAADTLINIASGVGSLGSGLVFAALGFAVTSWITILPAAIPLVLVLWLRSGGERLSPGKVVAG